MKNKHICIFVALVFLNCKLAVSWAEEPNAKSTTINYPASFLAEFSEIHGKEKKLIITEFHRVIADTASLLFRGFEIKFLESTKECDTFLVKFEEVLQPGVNFNVKDIDMESLFFSYTSSISFELPKSFYQGLLFIKLKERWFESRPYLIQGKISVLPELIVNPVDPKDKTSAYFGVGGFSYRLGYDDDRWSNGGVVDSRFINEFPYRETYRYLLTDPSCRDLDVRKEMFRIFPELTPPKKRPPSLFELQRIALEMLPSDSYVDAGRE
jgi:hypothetical protein